MMTPSTTLTQAGTMPAASSCIIAICQHCRENAVCLPVRGRHGLRAYWYCVESCYPKAMRATERTVRVGEARHQPPPVQAQGLCNCCGDWQPLRPVRLRTGWTSLKYCDGCWSIRLVEFNDVPECQCGARLRPSEYRLGRCERCQ